MPSRSDDERHILELVADHPEGVAISDLEDHLDVSRRTIQRRLKNLVERGELHREGKGPGTRYFAPKSSTTTTPADESAPSGSATEGMFSTEAREARRVIRQPVDQRTPVSYQTDFLAGYEPGVTQYLCPQTRSQLREVGSMTDEQLPAGTYARRILDRLLIDLSWNSSRLEGNTYSLLETERLLEAGIEAEERDPVETQMILNHKSAIEFLVDSAETNRLGFRRHVLLNLHALLSENLLDEPDREGRLRDRPVRISGSVYEPLANPHQIEEFFERILEKADAIDDAFEQSFFSLVHLPYLQPFLDANKRTSRLAANIPFIRDNLSPLSFVEVSAQQYANAMLAVYENNDVSILRDLFVWAYQRSARQYRAIRDSLGEPDPFRLRRRDEIKEVVGRVIRQAMTHPEATEAVDRNAESLPENERERFREAVWRELDGVHEGNFARYRVRPSQFEAWQRTWEPS